MCAFESSTPGESLKFSCNIFGSNLPLSPSQGSEKVASSRPVDFMLLREGLKLIVSDFLAWCLNHNINKLNFFN